MNQTFRSPEKQMPPLVTQHQLKKVKKQEEEPGLFLEIKIQEKESHDHVLQNQEAELGNISDVAGSRTGNIALAASSMTSTTNVGKIGADQFLNSDNDKNDYDWLLTPPGTPLFPSLEVESPKTVMNRSESQKMVMNRTGAHKAHPTAIKSRLSSTQPEVTGRNSLVSRPRAASPAPNTGPRRPSSSAAAGSGSGAGARSSTPTARPVSKNNPSSTTNVRAKSSTPVSTTAVRPRSSTPTSRPVLSSSKPTPTARSTASSSTPTSRASLSTTKPTSRAPTPPRRPTVVSTVTKTSAPSIKSSTGVTNSASSPNARPRPWKPHEMPGYSLDAPPNLRTSLTDRPISSMRGRAGAPSSRSSSIEPVASGKVRRQSCSPSRGRLPNGVNNRMSGNSVPIPALNRAYAKANDNVSPGLYGTKMVERVVNMRKLAPPKQDDKHSVHNNISAKSSSPDSSGFGRSLSKKSLDMAMRHMDIRRTLPGNLRPLMAKIPASSMFSVRSGQTRSRMINASDSPVATSSNASSEMSVNNHPIHELMNDECTSEKGVRTPASIGSR